MVYDMIFDSVKNCELYEGISPNLKAALDYMRENDLNQMEPGRYPVASGKVLVIIKKGYETKDDALAKWESHRRDIDIQYLLEGEERIGYAPVDALTPRTEYDEDSDKILYNNENGAGYAVHLKAGDFLVLFPDDAHATCLHPGAPCTCNKAVIKVAIC